MKLFFSLMLIISNSYNYAQEKNSFFLNYTLRSKDKIEVLDKFYEFINLPQNNYDTVPLWSESKFFKKPESDILDVINNAKNHRITILSINDINENKSVVKIAWIKNTNDFGNLYAIYNFIAFKSDQKIIFENILDYNVKDFKTFNVDEIKYFVYQEHVFNHDDAKKMVQFNKKMGLFFEKKTIMFTYFLCRDMNHFKSIRGFDFDSMMVDQNQIGGETFPRDNLIFAGNNSEYYPHEVVHLYTYQHFSKIHSIIDEGVATYFGGSKGIEFKDHIGKLKKHLSENDLNVYEKLFKESAYYTLDDTTSLMYTVGALLCDISLKKVGKEGLLYLMNSGKSDEELLQSIEQIFNIKRENFDHFIKSELKNY